MGSVTFMAEPLAHKCDACGGLGWMAAICGGSLQDRAIYTMFHSILFAWHYRLLCLVLQYGRARHTACGALPG